MSLRTLRNEHGAFVIRDAAAILATAANSLAVTEEEKTALMQRLVVNSWDNHSVIVDEAMVLGFDPLEAEETSSGDGGKGQGGPRLAGSRLVASSHVLHHCLTDEEIERLQRHSKL